MRKEANAYLASPRKGKDGRYEVTVRFDMLREAKEFVIWLERYYAPSGKALVTRGERGPAAVLTLHKNFRK